MEYLRFVVKIVNGVSGYSRSSQTSKSMLGRKDFLVLFVDLENDIWRGKSCHYCRIEVIGLQLTIYHFHLTNKHAPSQNTFYEPKMSWSKVWESQIMWCRDPVFE